MKRLLTLLIIVSFSTASHAALRAISIERLNDSNGNLIKYTVHKYTDANDGNPAELVILAGQNVKIAKIAKILDVNVFQLSKAPTMTWVYFQPDGSIDRVGHRLTGNFEERISKADTLILDDTGAQPEFKDKP